MRISRYLAAGILFVALHSAPAAFAQVVPTAPPDHIHIAVTEPEKAVEWYVKHFYGTKVSDPRPNQLPEVGYGKTVFRFFKRDGVKPSDGSVIDRVGFTVSDVDAKLAEVVADGAKVLMPARDGPAGTKIRVAFLQDPWNMKFEIIHDPDQANRLFFIALRAPDPEPLMKWVSDTFGGTPYKYQGRFDGLNYGDLWLLFQKSDGAVEPSRGHAIDHLGWPVVSMNDSIPQLRSKGYAISTEPHVAAPLTLAYIEGPSGFTVELTQFGDSAAK